MRDGTILRADIVRPDTTEGCPVLLCRTPYDRSSGISSPFLETINTAQHGYIVALQDVRGRGTSDGAWEPFVNEFDDGADSVEWAASLPGASGAVGMFGPSYLGFTQWAAATQQPSPLRAIVPALTWSNACDGLLSRGGTSESGLRHYLHHFGFATDNTDHDLVDALAAPYPTGSLAPLEQCDPTSCSIPADRHDPAVTIPALNIAGWYDAFVAGTIDHFQRARRSPNGSPGRQSRLIVGPWSHTNFSATSGNHLFGERASFPNLGTTGLQRLTLEWFDHWLRDQPLRHPWLTGPPVRSFDMGTNEWNSIGTWPPSTTSPATWHCAPDDRLRPAGSKSGHLQGTRLVTRSNPAWAGGAVHMHPTYPAGVVDQRSRPDTTNERHFTSDPFRCEVTIAGPVIVEVSNGTVDTHLDLVARLTVVHDDGYRRNLTDGVRRLDASTDVQTIELWPTHTTIRQGQRLQLTLSAGGWPRWGQPTPDGVEISISPIAIHTLVDHP